MSETEPVDVDAHALANLHDHPITTTVPAEAYVLGYRQGWDEALALAIQAVRTYTIPCFSNPTNR